MDTEKKIEQLEQTVANLAKVQDLQGTVITNQPNLSAMRNDNEELDVSKLLATLWHKKLLIIASAIIFTIAAVFLALSLPNVYRSSVLLMPNDKEQSNSGLGGLASQFGGLASLAGINLGGGSADKTGYALEVIESREFLYNFINNNDLKVKVMAVNGWDRNNNAYLYDQEIYDVNNKVWVREAQAPFLPEPSVHETYLEFLQNHLTVGQDKETGMVTISVSHYSPYFAKELVEKLVDALNETIKLQDIDEATKSIEYLKLELKNTKEVGLQAMFYQLIEQQQQTLMLAKVRSDYVLKIVDKAVVPEQKFKPKRAVIVALGGLLGVIFASVLVLIFSFKAQRE